MHNDVLASVMRHPSLLCHNKQNDYPVIVVNYQFGDERDSIVFCPQQILKDTKQFKTTRK